MKLALFLALLALAYLLWRVTREGLPWTPEPLEPDPSDGGGW